MDLKQIEYIVKIADTGSITKAAEQLFVTQSALNQQLLKLEHQLGIPLFYRRSHVLVPTDAGKVYLRYGRHMLQEKREAYNIINDLANNKKGHFTLTFSRERGLDMLVATYPYFHKEFPGIILEPQEMHVHQQIGQILKGYVDMGVVTIEMTDKIPNLVYDHIHYEPILLAIPRSSPLATNAAPPGTFLEDLPYLDLKLCKNLPFVLIFKNSTMRSIIDNVFAKNNFHPSVLFESSSVRALLTMVQNNMACTLSSSGYYNGQEDIAFFRIPGDPTWEMCCVYKRDAYLSQAMIYYKDLIKKYYHREQTKISAIDD